MTIPTPFTSTSFPDDDRGGAGEPLTADERELGGGAWDRANESEDER